MSSPEYIELTTFGLSTAVALHGAQLLSLTTAAGQELLWQGDSRYWTDRAPIHFPQIGPLVGGQIYHGGLGLRVDFPDSSNLANWSRPGVPYVCIEPWQVYPSQIDFEGPFLEKPGIALINPGDTCHWRLGTTLQPDGELHEALKDAVD